MKALAYVHQAEILLADDTDPATVGAMVTVALCGHWEHDGACRWPHHNEIDDGHRRFRTIFVAAAEEEPEVRRRIRAALYGQPGWRVVSDGERPVAMNEQALATELLRASRRV